MLFWDVDTQLDFLLPGGKLYVPGAEDILPNLARLTACARDRRWPLISSACAHLPGDAELQTYGPHCMAGTPGQQKAPETLLPHRYLVPNRRVDLPPLRDFQQIIIEKQAFDVFTNPNAENVVRQFGPALRIVLYGVVTEICVAAAARRLLERGYKISLVTDAVRALDPAREAGFVRELLGAGGELVTTAEVTDPNRALAA
jgi:nicotinamidase/pyrazinamidase